MAPSTLRPHVTAPPQPQWQLSPCILTLLHLSPCTLTLLSNYRPNGTSCPCPDVAVPPHPNGTSRPVPWRCCSTTAPIVPITLCPDVAVPLQPQRRLPPCTLALLSHHNHLALYPDIVVSPQPQWRLSRFTLTLLFRHSPNGASCPVP